MKSMSVTICETPHKGLIKQGAISIASSLFFDPSLASNM